MSDRDDYWEGDEHYAERIDEAKNDLFFVLSRAIPEIPALRQALVDGKIEGNIYSGDCACLKGTIANIRGCSVTELDGIPLSVNYPIEQWFLQIEEGDTPEDNECSALVVQWIDEFVAGLK